MTRHNVPSFKWLDNWNSYTAGAVLANPRWYHHLWILPSLIIMYFIYTGIYVFYKIFKRS